MQSLMFVADIALIIVTAKRTMSIFMSIAVVAFLTKYISVCTGP